jgi:hypothetical protein
MDLTSLLGTMDAESLVIVERIIKYVLGGSGGGMVFLLTWRALGRWDGRLPFVHGKGD